MQPGEEFVAVLKEVNEEFQREDYCPACWEASPQNGGDLLGVWQSRVPEPREKKKLFIDDDLLVNFFHRLAGADGASRINLRFVLTLVLMRKKLLVYDRMDKLPDGTEVWKMHLKGSQEIHEVTNPRLDDEKIAEVSGNLSEILEGQL